MDWQFKVRTDKWMEKLCVRFQRQPEFQKIRYCLAYFCSQRKRDTVLPAITKQMDHNQRTVVNARENKQKAQTLIPFLWPYNPYKDDHGTSTTGLDEPNNPITVF